MRKSIALLVILSLAACADEVKQASPGPILVTPHDQHVQSQMPAINQLGPRENAISKAATDVLNLNVACFAVERDQPLSKEATWCRKRDKTYADLEAKCQNEHEIRDLAARKSLSMAI